MRQKKWFETRYLAKKELKKRIKEHPSNTWDGIYLWKHTKRKRRYYVGTYLQWINE